MKTYNTFWDHLFSELKPTLKLPKYEKAFKNGSAQILEPFFGVTSKKGRKSVIKLSKQEDFLKELLYEYSEISEALERMKMSVFFIKHFPLKKKMKLAKISEVDYLRYHFEMAINEYYIFYERVKRLLSLLSKRCKRANLLNEAENIESLKTGILDKMNNFNCLRGQHVHKRRYESQKMYQVKALCLFSDSIDDDNSNDRLACLLEDFKKREYEALKKESLKNISLLMEALGGVLNRDIYINLKDIIFEGLLNYYKKNK